MLLCGTPQPCFQHAQTSVHTQSKDCTSAQQKYWFCMKRLQLNGLHCSLEKIKRHACLALRKRHHEQGERKKRKSQLECEEVKRGRQKQAEWDKKNRERDIYEWKGQRSLPSFDGPGRKQGPGFISSVCHRGDSCSHQHQPRGIQISTRGKRRKRNKRNQKAEHLQLPFAVKARNQKTARGLGWVTVNGTESMTARRHSSVAPKTHSFLKLHWKNKAKCRSWLAHGSCRVVFI